MARKKSEKEYLNSFEEIFPGRYVYGKFPEKFNQKTKIDVYCKKHKMYFSINLNNLMNGHGCPKCGKESMAITKGLNNQEKYKEIIELNYGNIFDLSEINYKNCRYDKSNIFVTCKKCGKRQKKNISELVHNRAGCLCDKHERMDWYYNKLRKTQILKIREFSKRVFGNRLSFPDLDETYIDGETKIKVHCNLDNYDFYIKPMNFLYKYQSCPICSAKRRMSSFARATMYFLEDHNIVYHPEFVITSNNYLKNKPYDFYLSEYNLLVEIDGDQHRRPAFGKTNEDLMKQKEIDAKKVIEGNNEGFQVLRLNTDENFLLILEEYLKNLKSSTTIPEGSRTK